MGVFNTRHPNLTTFNRWHESFIPKYLEYWELCIYFVRKDCIMDAKLDTLRALVMEYVQHINLWGDVTVEPVTKDVVPIPRVSNGTDVWGNPTITVEHDEMDVQSLPYVRVTYHTPKGKWIDILHPNGFESMEFPLHDLDRRIRHYRNKLYSIRRMKKDDN